MDCDECGSPITSKWAKRFCGMSCSAKSHNRTPGRKHGPSPTPRTCVGCGAVFFRRRGRSNVYCSGLCRAEASSSKSTEAEQRLLTTSKAELFEKRSTWQAARSVIQEHARQSYLAQHPQPSCVACGYSIHVEVCHRVAVSAFPGGALVAEINAPTNLVGLCPTHHWEFDNGYLII